MSTDLEQRIADLAAAWERDAAPVTYDEITGAHDHVPSATTIELTAATTTARRRWAIALLGAAAAIAAVVLLAVRHEPDPIDPVAPVASDPDTAAPSTTAPATVAPPRPTTVVPTTPATTTPPTTDPTPLSDAEASAALAQLEANRSAALRRLTSIGFDVQRTTTYPDGRVYDDGSPTAGSVHVVLRNDGSAAVVSDSFGVSYYDAITGTARASYTDADGNPAYQEIVGQADGSVALGVPTGLTNGVVTSIAQLRDGLIGITDDVIDGRSTWRVDQRTEDLVAGDGSTSLQQTWIDQATGITVQTTTSGQMAINDVPLDETITLTHLEPGAALPADFPNPFPTDAAVASSGDPSAFGPITDDLARAEFDRPILVPGLPADQVSIARMNFGTTDGGTEMSPSLVARWFDGFVRTELRITGYPSMMTLPDSCPTCTGSLLDELRSLPVTADGVNVSRAGIGVSLTGDPDTIRAVIASLTEPA
jgi:hypothetical protein